MKYAGFEGRWDDPDHLYRTTYAGNSAYACWLEVLAPLRPDPLDEEVAPHPKDDQYQPDTPPGHVPIGWLERRSLGTATLSGTYVAIGHSGTLQWLRTHALHLLLSHRVTDIDGAAVRGDNRAFTQALSRWLYESESPRLDGVRYDSRHGDRLTLWAVFERSTDGAISAHLSDVSAVEISPTDKELRRALGWHGLLIAP